MCLMVCLICFRFKYKDEYEKFKLILSVIGFLLSVINLFTNIRWAYLVTLDSSYRAARLSSYQFVGLRLIYFEIAQRKNWFLRAFNIPTKQKLKSCLGHWIRRKILMYLQKSVRDFCDVYVLQACFQVLSGEWRLGANPPVIYVGLLEENNEIVCYNWKMGLGIRKIRAFIKRWKMPPQRSRLYDVMLAGCWNLCWCSCWSGTTAP